MITVYPVGAFLVLGSGVSARMSKDLNPSNSRLSEKDGSPLEVSLLSARMLQCPSEAELASGSDVRALAPFQDLLMGLVSFHLPLHP